MIILEGKHNTAKVFTDNVESKAVSQIIELLNEPFAAGSKIRIMPDVHAGAGCTIGTTMTLTDKVVPNLVGVDISCGVSVTKLDVKAIDFEKLDNVIREHVPSGFDVRKIPAYAELPILDKLKCQNVVNKGRALASVGSLGGGNHFIEINKGNEGNLYLVIHTGSRNLGLTIAKHYQEKAIVYHQSRKKESEEIIEKLKKEGRESEISAALLEIKKSKKVINKDLVYLEGQDMFDYLHDVKIAEDYAFLNRLTIATTIVEKMGWKIEESFQSVHNYIDIPRQILRKGAVSAQKGEKLIIPINMRDGSLICIGKGNPDWNYSAPHGAGRIMSRGKAKENIQMEDFTESMKDVWTTSVKESTIDEAPFAYKELSEIVGNIGDTVEIVERIIPVYNFKAN